MGKEVAFHEIIDVDTDEDRNDAVSGKKKEGEPKKAPLTLYNSIQQALAARKDWEAKRTKTSELELVFAENFVNNIAECYKRKKLLPLSWKYNPATASTHEPKDDFPLLLRLDGKSLRCEYGPYFDSYICIKSTKPEVLFVPLKDYETESWLEFKKLDEGNFSSIPGIGKGWLLSTKHPFVSVIGDFAVNGFNQAFEMYVMLRRATTNASIILLLKSAHTLTRAVYKFEMTIVADEDGFRGIYEAEVACRSFDCKKILLRLALTGVKHDVGLWLPDIQATGMFRRRTTIYGITYGGYDYEDPNDIDDMVC